MPDLIGHQIVFVRCIVGMAVLGVYLNTKLPYVMFWSFPKELRRKFVLRICCGVCAITSIHYLAKFFQLTTIAVVANLSPVLTLIIGIIFLKEKASNLDVACVLLSFLGVTLMTLGVIKQRDQIQEMSDEA